MHYVIQCRFSEFLVQLCIKKRFYLGPSRNITTVCRKIAFFGVRAEILLSRNQGGLDSRAGPFLGYVQIYKFLEKYSPLSPPFFWEPRSKTKFWVIFWEIFPNKSVLFSCGRPLVLLVCDSSLQEDVHS